MVNTILTPTQVTRKALAILHQKLNFVGSITRDYDDSYAKTGAKIGDSLKIRLPNQYTVRTGATLSTQDTTESSVTLQVNNQIGVDMTFTSADLTMSLDDFTARILDPAVAVIAANIESTVLSNVYKDVYNQVNNHANAATFNKVLQGRKRLVDELAPMDGRSVTLNTQDNVDMVDALKGLFNDTKELSSQYRDGVLGRTAGFDFSENTLLPSHTVGTKAGTPLTNGATQSGASLISDGWTNSTAALKKGDVFTIAAVYRVHPETKVSTGVLQQFVATADGTADGSGNLTIAISPSIIATGATQNVSNTAADNSAITVAGTASTAHGISLAYQKGAFAFATADLIMPEGVDFAARENFDGISMRIVRQYAIATDTFPCRLDVLYGYKTLRANLAARLANN